MGKIIGTPLASFERRKVEWLWKPFIHKGVVNLLTGGPGTGKSTIACDIAAALSTGRPLPGETDGEAKTRGILRTWLLNAEDDPNDTIGWRADNQGADSNRIFVTAQGQPIDKQGAADIIDFVRANNIALVVVDPIQAWIGQETDMYRPNHMRAWGNLFREICQLTGTTVLWVRHRRKGDADDHNSINSGLGSIDLSGIVRSEIGAMVTKKGSKITRIKGSVGPTNSTLYYQIMPTENDHGQLKWSGAVRQETPKADNKSNGVQEWLIGQLVDGPKPTSDLTNAATKLYGCSKETVRLAAKEVAVLEKVDSKWMWRLRTPRDVDANSPDDTEGQTGGPA